MSETTKETIAGQSGAPTEDNTPPTKGKFPAKAGSGFYAWKKFHKTGPGAGLASGNGRIEATEIDVATKLAGRLDEVFVDDGDFVTSCQMVAPLPIRSISQISRLVQ